MIVFGLTVSHQYYLHNRFTDMRKGFDGLCGVIRGSMGSDPTDGSVYIFINRRRDRMKLLVWESGGFVLYYKRLERGTFEFPSMIGKGGKIHLSWEMLVLMLSGISIRGVRKRKRYIRA